MFSLHFKGLCMTNADPMDFLEHMLAIQLQTFISFVLMLGSLRKCWCQVMGCLDHVRGHGDQVYVTGQTKEG